MEQIALSFGYADYFAFCIPFKQYAYVPLRVFRESRRLPVIRK